MIEVACTRIIESANTIMDYDLRNGLDNKIDGICPVIKALYKTSPGHSELRLSPRILCDL